MDASFSIISELQRVNVSLTQALCHQQDVASKLKRELLSTREDLAKSKQHVSALEQVLMQMEMQPQQQQQQQNRPAPNAYGHPGAPTAWLGSFPGVPPPAHPIAHHDESLFEHRTAGTLLSPGKQSRRLLSHLDENAPLRVCELLPKKKQSSKLAKRAPVSSPPAKPIQKRPSHRPTPIKLKQMKAGGVSQEQGDQDSDARLAVSIESIALPPLSLVDLKKADWKVSGVNPNPSSCHAVITAMLRTTEGDISKLQASLDWMIKNVSVYRNAVQQTSGGEAVEVVGNIEKWLQYNLSEKFSEKGGTLKTELGQAVQVICSAALFNRTKMNTDLVRRTLPSLGGKRRLKTMKEFNKKLINDGTPFYWPDRKVRKDAFWPLLCQFVRRKICWNDRYTKVDTNFSRKIKCKEPIIQPMDGGGFRLAGWKLIEREMRMWYEETTLQDVMKLVKNSDEWKQLKEEYPSISMGKNSLRLALCPSVRKPSFRSCVNEKMSALSYLMEDLYSVVNNNDVLRKRIDECPCRRHRTARDMRAMDCTPPSLWHDELRCLPSRFCGLATCAKKEQLHMKVGDKDAPTLRDQRCTKSLCPDCGFAKKLGLGDPECTAFKDCSELMEVTLWEKASRNGDRFQREPTRHTGADRKSVAEVHRILVEDVAPDALEHLGEAQWWHAQVERKIETFGQDEIVVLTDFSATPELIAKEVGNCHEAEHCVIDIFVVVHDPRIVEVEKDGVTTLKRVNSCTYWAFLGPTDGKGKKNDHRFHREALHTVVDFHKNEARERSQEIKTVTLLTDNCSGQYKSQYNLGDVAWFAERHPGIRLEHGYATVFEFKGVHDGFGKTIKWKFKEAELKGRRIPNAKEGYGYLIEKYAGRRSDWDNLEKEHSPKLLQRGPFTMTEVRVGYVADTVDEVESVLQQFGGEHILHCDRNSVPRTVGDKAAEGLTDVYNVRGKRESVLAAADGNRSWEIEMASRVCFCAVCSSRDSHSEPCPYEEIRDVRRIVVDDKANDADWCQEQRAKRAVSVYFRKKKQNGYVNIKQMKEELQHIGKAFPANAKRMDLALIFLSMQETAETDEQQLLSALGDEVQNPLLPTLDDNDTDRDNGNEPNALPISEEEAPTDIDLLLLNDIEEENNGTDYNISDNELKLMPDFSSLNDTVLRSLLFHRRLPATGSRADQEERLREAVRPF